MRISVTMAGLSLLLVAMPALAQSRRPLQVADLFRLQRMGDPQVSPDGTMIAYTVTKVDLEANKTRTNIWVVGANPDDRPRQLTSSTKSDRHPRWSPNSKQILFESSRSGEGQLWIIDLAGGEASQLTTLSTGAQGGMWSPDGKKVGFVSAVYPEYSDKPFKESDGLNKKKKEEIEKNPVKARVFTKLFYRHWDEWVEDKRQHLFVVSADGGDPLDVTPGDRDANPTSSTFSVGDDFTFSPDSRFLLYTAVPVKDEAWSTNYEICRVSAGGGKVETLTRDNQAADGTPCFSPDGKHLIYRRQLRAGFEADRWQLMMVDTDPSGKWTGKPRSLTAELDSSVSDYVWAGNNRILFTAEIGGSSKLFSLDINDKTGFVYRDQKLKGTRASVLLAASYGSQGAPSCDREGSTCAYTLASLDAPPEVRIHKIGRDPADFTAHRAGNDAILRELDLPRPQSVTVPGAGGTPVQMWILQPPGFNPRKKWPLVFLVHGGPQGAWEDSWSNRWNPEVWAAQGYVVALPNPRGSTGFGQQFVDEISGDWGGRCFEDLMACLAYLEKQPYIDKNRMASAGASFGGYMMNWFQGHTDKFKTLITHCGVYNFDSMYATTDEIWFDEWEHGGPPWANRASYEKYSPHLYAKNFKTPMLIIHNDLDFRVPLSEGYQLFSTLQRLGVPSRLVNFPDEGHWVLKPANSKFWHQEVFDWLKKYVPPGGK
jgi:dipeptidyl aminopeptidase/acylaminoacyl peptidase